MSASCTVRSSTSTWIGSVSPNASEILRRIESLGLGERSSRDTAPCVMPSGLAHTFWSRPNALPRAPS
jgi:hypothetical protein